MCANCQSGRDAWSSHCDTVPIFWLSEVSDVPVWDPSLSLSLYLSPVSPLSPGSELARLTRTTRSLCLRKIIISLLVSRDKVKHQEREHGVTLITLNRSLDHEGAPKGTQVKFCWWCEFSHWRWSEVFYLTVHGVMSAALRWAGVASGCWEGWLLAGG